MTFTKKAHRQRNVECLGIEGLRFKVEIPILENPFCREILMTFLIYHILAELGGHATVYADIPEIASLVRDGFRGLITKIVKPLNNI